MTNKKSFFIISFFLLTLVYCRDVYSWDNVVTHKDLSYYAALNSILSKDKGDYLKNIGFYKGLLEVFQWDGSSSLKIGNINDWLREGSYREDAGSNFQGFIGMARYNNHFHNPLKQWGSAGLDDTVLGVRYSGESSILWAQYGSWQGGYIEGDWSWKKTRDCFYSALTTKKETDRRANFAQTFRGLGHQMHLVQDMSQPDHVRNDMHPEDAILGSSPRTGEYYFETWASKYSDVINGFAGSPIKPSLDLSISQKGFVPISQFIDTEQYTGSAPSTSSSWGLAEYTNSNFVSDDTIFTENSSSSDGHYFPFPRYNTQCYELITEHITSTKNRQYLKKNCEGESINHFAVPSPWWKYLGYPYFLDSTVHQDYASKLIPRAVGYSAALVNYFFRGDIRLEYDASAARPGYVIKNKTDDDLNGLFQIFYDNKNDERIETMSGSFGLKKSETGATFDIAPPADAKESGKYILVFKGTMGNEKDAVAGYVTSRVLEITPPDQSVYSIIAAEGDSPKFETFKVKLRNPTNETMQNGTLIAIAKYKTNTNDLNFLYSSSEPKSGITLSSTAKELSFDFSNDPIPVNATDFFLEIVFKGTIGGDEGATALGVKDISEPTPIDVFNNTDKSCVNGSWYFTNEAIDLVDSSQPKDHIADLSDVNPHLLEDIYVKVSLSADPQAASASVYDTVVPSLYPGEFKRVLYILSDYNFKYSFYSNWKADPDYTDNWSHVKTLHTLNGTAVKNQTDYTSDPDVCGNDPSCYKYYYPKYYSLRGNDMWWGGGIVFINSPYPADSSCQGY